MRKWDHLLRQRPHYQEAAHQRQYHLILFHDYILCISACPRTSRASSNIRLIGSTGLNNDRPCQSELKKISSSSLFTSLTFAFFQCKALESSVARSKALESSVARSTSLLLLLLVLPSLNIILLLN